MKYALARSDGGVWGEDFDDEGTIVLRSTEIGPLGQWQVEAPARRRLAPAERIGSLVRIGDLLVVKSSGSEDHLGKTALVNDAIATLGCAFSNFLQRLAPDRSCDPKYLFYLFNSSVAREHLNYFGTTTTGLRNLTRGIIGDLVLPGADIESQRRIADVLDRKTAAIDDLIAKKERLIALLVEKRQAFITRAVTKGLDLTAAMKPSGNESIGSVPHQWLTLRNKVFMSEINDRSLDGDEELLTVSHLTGVTPRSEKHEVTMFLAESLVDYKRVRKHDVAVNTMWAWMGALGVAPCDGVVSPSYNVYRFRTSWEVEPEYFDLLFRTPPFVAEINRWSRGIWTSRLRLYPEEFLSMVCPIPPFKEQKEIVAYVKSSLAHDAALSAAAAKSVMKLREYRQALITAAVTGKLDVQRADSRADLVPDEVAAESA